MTGFISGLAIGLAVAWWVKYRADAHWINTNKAIYDGWLTPDENGFVGHSRHPEQGRFPEVGNTAGAGSRSLEKCNHPKCAAVFQDADYCAKCSICDVDKKTYLPWSWPEYVQARNNVLNWPSRSIPAKESE
jgi:hypothetical protein